MLSLKLFTIIAIFGLALAQGPAPSTQLSEEIPVTTGGWEQLEATDPEVRAILVSKINSGSDLISDDDTVLCASFQEVAGNKEWFISVDIDKNPVFDGRAILVWVIENPSFEKEVNTLTVDEDEAQAACTSATPPDKNTDTGTKGWTRLNVTDPEVQDIVAMVNASEQLIATNSTTKYDANAELISDNDTILCASSQISAGNEEWFISVDIDKNPIFGGRAILAWVVVDPNSSDPSVVILTVEKDEAQAVCASPTPPDVQNWRDTLPPVSPPEGGSRSACMVVAPLVVAMAAMLF